MLFFRRIMPSLWSLNSEELDSENQLFGTMPWSTRIQGFALFTLLGFIANFLAWLTLTTGHLKRYGALFTLGNLCSIFATMILMGPLKQVRTMCDETRRVATGVYFFTMVLTLVSAFYLQSPLLTALCTIAQYAALIWYSLSYIPYGRHMIKTCLLGCSRMVISV